VLDAPMWHSASVLSEDSAFGDVLHSFFGYSDAPTPLQLLVYVGYLAIVIVVYLGIRGKLAARAAPVVRTRPPSLAGGTRGRPPEAAEPSGSLPTL
jgi:hypothetical protein